MRRQPPREAGFAGTPAVAGVAATDQQVDEGAVVCDAFEVARAPEQQRVLERALEMAVRRLDRAVLMGETAVVAAGSHAVVGAESSVALGPVLLDRRREVAERGRKAVGAMLARGAAEGPERVLQAGGERDEALALQHDMGVLEAAEGEPKMVEPVGQRRTRHGNAGRAHLGEIRQAYPARLVDLAEHHLALGAMERAPLADTTLQRAPDPDAEFGMPAQQFLEHGDGPQAGTRLQHGDVCGRPVGCKREFFLRLG